MVKRIWALVLCAVLLLSILPVCALAANENEMLIEKTRKSYESGLEATGQESFHGLCGTMVAYQLKYFGVSIYPEAWDGNKQYDNYAGKNITSGGYYVDAYPATEYSLEQALDVLTANGTRDVYNILVGFETTNTEAGALFGHACVITAIVDGTVYFAESFDTSFGVEGTVICCTIKEFAAFYSDWAVFEGLVCFSMTMPPAATATELISLSAPGSLWPFVANPGWWGRRIAGYCGLWLPVNGCG